MDPITAVGLAASIIQLVDFGTRVIKRLVEYQAQCEDLPQAFSHLHTQLPLLVQILEQTRQEVRAGKTDQNTRNALSSVVDGCKSQLDLLDQVLLIIVPQPLDSRPTRVKKAVLSLRKQSDVEKIHGHITTYVSTLTFYFAWYSTRPQIQNQITRILTILSVPDPTLTYQKALKQHQPNTCNWFLDYAYTPWKTLPASLVWLQGGPGCGKTVLSSFIIRNLEDEVSKDVAKACAYHFFTFNDKAQQKPENMIKSLICQLILRCVDVPPSVNRLEHKVTAPLLEEALRDILASLPTVYLVIDALDECDRDRQNELMAMLELFAVWKMDHVHILLTSRKEQALEVAFETLIPKRYRLWIAPSDVDRDIGIYVRAHLESDKNFRRWKNDDAIRKQIEAALTTGAGGMFRWAACQMDELAGCLNRAMVFRCLKNLPRNLDETYDRILQSIDQAYAPYALQVLRWLAFARISLTVAQVSHITGIVDDNGLRFDENEVLPDPHDILTVCKSLVTVVEVYNVPFEASIVRLAHFTVQQYLTSDRIREAGHASLYSIRPQPTEALLAKQCIVYLTEFGSAANHPRGAPFRASRDEYEKFPLAAYALYEWNYHSTAGAPDISVDLAALKFMRHPAAYLNCFLRFGKELSRNRSPKNVLHDACTLGFTGVVKLMLDIVDSRSVHAGMADPATAVLPTALVRDADPWTEDWLRQAAKIDASALLQPFLQAVHHDHTAIVDLLIDRLDNTKNAYQRILVRAAQSGRVDWLEWLRVRRKTRSDDSIGRSERDALPHASYLGHLEVMEGLLDVGIDINVLGARGTPLEAAVLGNQPDSIQLLLAKGANVNTRGLRGTALYSAAVYQRVEFVRALLTHGAKLDIPGERGLPTDIAAERSLEILQLFVETGTVDINATNSEGETVFEIACKAGPPGTAEYLIAQGAGDADADDSRRNVLQIASYHRKENTVELLIGKGMDLNRVLPDGTALQLAATKEDKDNPAAIINTVKLLVDAGADVDTPGPNGTALQIASYSHQTEIVELLVGIGVDLDRILPNGTALQHAITKEDKKNPAAIINTIKLLVEAGANVDILGPKGTALQLAAQSKDMTASSIVKYLVQKGADINAPGPNGTALQLAIEHSSTRIVDFLLCHGAKVKLAGPKGNALEIVCRGKREDVARLLVLFAEFEKDPP